MRKFVAVFRSRRPGTSLARMEKALGELDPVTREAFLLHRLHGLGYAAIAARLGVSVAEVEGCIAPAMLQLADALNDGPGAGD